MNEFSIHPQLLTDCHHLGRLPATYLLLHRNAAVPWFILVPKTALANLLDLPLAQREAVLADCKRVSDYLTGTLGWVPQGQRGLDRQSGAAVACACACACACDRT